VLQVTTQRPDAFHLLVSVLYSTSTDLLAYLWKGGSYNTSAVCEGLHWNRTTLIGTAVSAHARCEEVIYILIRVLVIHSIGIVLTLTSAASAAASVSSYDCGG
jgi:hypothetical protein